VEQREHAVHDVAGPGVIARRQVLLDVGEEVAVAQHRRSGRAGGAAGEQQGGEGVALDRGDAQGQRPAHGREAVVFLVCHGQIIDRRRI